MNINVVHQYSRLIENLLRLTYDALGVNMTGTLKVCDGCARPKAKEIAILKKTYKQATNPGEMIFVDTTGPFPETLIGNCYWTGIADDYKCYFWSIYKNMKLQLLKKIGEFFEK